MEDTQKELLHNTIDWNISTNGLLKVKYKNLQWMRLISLFSLFIWVIYGFWGFVIYGYRHFSYFTIWAFYLTTFLILFNYITCRYQQINCSKESLWINKYHKISSVILEICISLNLIVTIIYWIILYRTNQNTYMHYLH